MSGFIPRMPDLSHVDFRNNINASAELFFENMRQIIEAYEARSDDKHQVIWKVAAINGKEYPVHKVGYINPSLIRFESREMDGSPCELLVHVASVQFIIQVVEVRPEEPKRKIGFQRDQDSAR